MAQNTPWHLINRYFEKNITANEQAELNEWRKNNPENEQLLSELHNIFSVTNRISGILKPDHRKAWAKIDQRISTGRMIGKLLYKKIKYAAAAAAILLICLSSALLVNNIRNNQILRNKTEIFAPLGQKTMVTLPDGSKVWLNSGSSLLYEGNFNLKKREVILTGEAYFEVQTDESKRFRVKTGVLNVDVYGTAFNIKNYRSDKTQEITVSEGKVGVSGKKGKIRHLNRGDQVVLDKESNQLSFRKSSPEIVTAWKNNELIFDNTSMKDVVNYLQRWYGVNITIGNISKKNPSYTFKVKTESLREMLEMMRIMTPFEYDINGKNVRIRYTE